ncbi:MAG: hypothetical protein ABSH28_06545, partial [Acidobacteriota bacterium]
MKEITIKKDSIPLWSGATGSVVVDVNLEDPSQPLVPGDSPIVNASFNLSAASGDIRLGTAGTVGIGIKAGTNFKVAPLWKDHINAAPDLVGAYGLAGFLTDQNMMLALQIGANADFTATGSFRYTVLSAGVTLGAGADGGLVQVRVLPRTTPFGAALNDLFGNLRLPSNVTVPPAAGEVIALEYGGYLKFGLSAAAGYELKGTKSFDIADLKLSEHYDLSVTGKLALNGQMAGRFSVEVRQGDQAGWANVSVTRKRTRDFSVLADLNIGAEIDTQGLPASGKEFLGALIGIRAKNWLNLIDSAASQAGAIDSLDALKAKLDGLAGDFISKYAGKAIDQLLPAEVTTLLSRLKKVVESYNNLDQSAIALFDRYFDPVLNKVKDLEADLQTLHRMVSWDQLQGEVDPMLWNIVQQLTGGDPLNAILGGDGTLAAFKKKIDDTLALIQDGAHEEIRNIIKLAKSEFGLDHFMSLLDSVDSPDKLKTALSNEGKHFVERLLNNALDKLNGKGLTNAFQIVRRIVQAKDAFWAKFDAALKAAAKQTFSLGIESSYAKSNEKDALIDLDIRLLDDQGQAIVAGQRFMAAAGRGDFQEILASYQPAVVKLKKGSLTHNSSTTTGIKINIAGWHLDYQYQEMYRVIVNADQQIRPTDNGMVNVFTTIDMTDAKQVRRKSSKSEQEMHSNFLLRYLGETNVTMGDHKFDKDDESYLVDVITAQSASYATSFTSTNATPAELADALAFAKTLGLDNVGATDAGLAPYIEVKNGRIGPVTAEYTVRFTVDGLKALALQQLSQRQLELEIREIL